MGLPEAPRPAPDRSIKYAVCGGVAIQFTAINSVQRRQLFIPIDQFLIDTLLWGQLTVELVAIDIYPATLDDLLRKFF